MTDFICTCVMWALQEGGVEGSASDAKVQYIQADEEMLPLGRHSVDCKPITIINPCHALHNNCRLT